MLKKIKTIFLRDLKVNSKDFISLYILVVPILFGLLINLFSPGVNETTINLALIEEENTEQVEYFEQFAKVELFEDAEAVENRVQERDAMIGILSEEGDYYLLTQGNESDEIVDYAKLLLTSYELGLNIDDSKSSIIEYDRSLPALKKILVNLAILLLSILGGMLIALNIVEEKADNTLSAINLSPTPRIIYLIGKSMMGIVFSIFGSLTLVLITGFGTINLIQLVIIVLVTSLLSVLVGFIQGLTNTDVIGAASSIKLLFLPLLAAFLAIEWLADKWQVFFYWNPFYWAYKGNDAILAQTGSWNELFFYSGIVFFLSSLIFFILAPKIRKALE